MANGIMCKLVTTPRRSRTIRARRCRSTIAAGRPFVLQGAAALPGVDWLRRAPSGRLVPRVQRRARSPPWATSRTALQKTNFHARLAHTAVLKARQRAWHARQARMRVSRVGRLAPNAPRGSTIHARANWNASCAKKGDIGARTMTQRQPLIVLQDTSPRAGAGTHVNPHSLDTTPTSQPKSKSRAQQDTSVTVWRPRCASRALLGCTPRGKGGQRVRAAPRGSTTRWRRW